MLKADGFVTKRNSLVVGSFKFAGNDIGFVPLITAPDQSAVNDAVNPDLILAGVVQRMVWALPITKLL